MRQGIKIVAERNVFFGKKPDNRSVLYVFLLTLSFLCVSCLKEKGSGDCPVVYEVTFGVKDKNYTNAGNIPGWPLKDEQLPFNAYVPTLMYYLRNEETRAIVQNVPAYTVANDDKQQVLDLVGIPPGRYILSAFGNDDRAALDRDGILSYDLHPTGMEGADVYLLSDTIELTPDHLTAYAELQRTKGILYLLLENLPDSVDRIECRVSGIYRNVDQNGEYRDETVVQKTFTGSLSPSVNGLLSLAPTMTGKISVVRLALYAKDADLPFMFIPDFNVTVKRNEVTAFRLNFKLDGGVEVWTAADGAWTKLHDMDITMS